MSAAAALPSADPALPDAQGPILLVGFLAAAAGCVWLGCVATWRVLAAVVICVAAITAISFVTLGADARRQPDQCDRLSAGPPSNRTCWVTVSEQVWMGAWGAAFVLLFAAPAKLIRDNPA